MSIPSTKGEIIWRVNLRSDPQKVFELLSTDAGRRSFWAEEADERNGAIHFVFVNGVRTVTPILGRSEPELFELRYFDSHVRFDLVPDGAGGTDLTLRNRDVPDSLHEEVLAGWLNVLFPLKARADFDVDLRSHDPTRTWERGYIDQ